MTPAERDAFLGQRLVSRLGTLRADLWPHVAPVWYLWEQETFVHSLGPGRTHLKNLAANRRVTECIDADYRLEHGLGAGAAAVVCFGEAEFIDDDSEARELMERILVRYLGATDAARYLAPSLAELAQGRRLVRVHPQRWLTWDYRKVG